MSLFAPPGPLAERMRPQTLEEFLGQGHLVGSGRMLRQAIEKDQLPSLILWGPPGCGKTSLAQVLAHRSKAAFVPFSAVHGGLPELRLKIQEAQERLRTGQRTLLFVDEIHRFNKAQQDAFLPHVENGTVILIGATTENPSFSLNNALLSRARVLVLQPLSPPDLDRLVERALREPERGLGGQNLAIDEAARQHLIRSSEGDARRLLNALETAAGITEGGGTISLEAVEEALQHKVLPYDQAGEEHFNLLSAFHKSLRGSDPDASLYWAFRMLAAGEEPRQLIRRLVCAASEDVGNADPGALRVALDALRAYEFLGMPEGELALAQAITYVACAPKSNASYLAKEAAKKAVHEHGALPVPIHLRNAPTRLLKELGYGKAYRYPHDFPGGWVAQQHLPDALQGERFYEPKAAGYEAKLKSTLENRPKD